MKSFKEFLEENHLNHVVAGNAGLSSMKVPYDLDDANVKNAVNAVLGHVAVSEFMNPHAALGQIESKLSQMGLAKIKSVGDMGELQQEDFADSGELNLSFSRYGEITGKSVDTPIDELDKEEKTYDLKVRYEKLETGSFKVYGNLV